MLCMDWYFFFDFVFFYIFSFCKVAQPLFWKTPARILKRLNTFHILWSKTVLMVDVLVVIFFTFVNKLLVVVCLLSSITHFPCDVSLNVVSGLRMFFINLNLEWCCRFGFHVKYCGMKQLATEAIFVVWLLCFRWFLEVKKYQPM